MKRLIIKMLLPALAISAFIAGCQKSDDLLSGTDSTSERLASLEQQVQSMENTIALLEEAMKASDSQLKNELEAKIKALRDAVDAITGIDSSDWESAMKRLEALEKSLSETSSELSKKIAEAEAKLSGKLGEAEVKALLGELKAELAGEISSTETEIEALQESVAGLSTSVSNMQNQLDAMRSALQSAIDGKVDNATYEAFVTQTNEQIQSTSAMLSELLAVCNGFSGTSIKEYIDDAVASLTSMLDSYVLQSTYETFIEEYGKTKNDLQTQINANKSKITELEELVKALTEIIENGSTGGALGELTSLTQKVGELTTRIEELEKNSLTLEQMQAQFTKDNQAFLNGVNSILLDALANDGAISAAIASSAEALRQEYTERINSLESRIGELEGQVADLIHRIQSLVYVPKTSDGKIHIGTTYIAQTDSEGNDIGARIHVTPTKKLEYRVSPANLRDELLELPLDCFSFYQEHVTRAAFEGSGMDEFHIVKIEEGNGPGEILITVDNEHDFTHEDLAVALCIKHTSSNGILTEFTSPYTTVVGDGRNIRDRFYLAKQYNGEWVVCRDDNVSYLIRYNDTSSTVAFRKGEYYVVYDSGESVMTLDEAKERFEWQIDLKASAEGIANAFSVKGLGSNAYTVTPTDPNADRTKEVTAKLRTSNAGNIRGKVSDKYTVYLSDGDNKVVLIPEVNVSLTVIGTSYTVDAGQIVWNYTTWNAGRNSGNTSYQTDYCNIKTTADISNKSDLSHLPDSDISEIFARNAEWSVSKAAGEESTIQGVLSATSGPALSNGNKRDIQFSVNGYIYSDGTERLSLTRTIKPSHLVGSEPLEITAEVEVVAPDARTAVVNASSIASTTAKAYLYYFHIGDSITATEKKPVYTVEEITKFFNGNKGYVSSMLAIGSLSGAASWQDEDGHMLPVRAELIRNDETGSGIIANSLTALPAQISPALTTPGSYTFTAPENYFWRVPNGPKIPVTGTITVNKTE